MVKVLENILALSLKQGLVYSHKSLAKEWLFFCVFNLKRNVFVPEENLHLLKRELLKDHESFPISGLRGVYQYKYDYNDQ